MSDLYRERTSFSKPSLIDGQPFSLFFRQTPPPSSSELLESQRETLILERSSVMRLSILWTSTGAGLTCKRSEFRTRRVVFSSSLLLFR